MIYFNFNIRNPWGSDFKSLWWKSGDTLFKHKHWEAQAIKNDNWLRFEVGFTVRQDHAGANLELGLFGYEIHFTFYDSRHWDDEKGCWVDYSKELHGEDWTETK
jgi:hypothetical protein